MALAWLQTPFNNPQAAFACNLQQAPRPTDKVLPLARWTAANPDNSFSALVCFAFKPTSASPEPPFTTNAT
jgi:hypothetical protein